MFVGQMSRLKHPRGGRKITDREILVLSLLPVRRKCKSLCDFYSRFPSDLSGPQRCAPR